MCHFMAIETNDGTTGSDTYIGLELIWAGGEVGIEMASLVFSITLLHSLLNLILFEETNTGSDDRSS